MKENTLVYVVTTHTEHIFDTLDKALDYALDCHYNGYEWITLESYILDTNGDLDEYIDDLTDELDDYIADALDTASAYDSMKTDNYRW